MDFSICLGFDVHSNFFRSRFRRMTLLKAAMTGKMVLICLCAILRFEMIPTEIEGFLHLGAGPLHLLACAISGGIAVKTKYVIASVHKRAQVQVTEIRAFLTNSGVDLRRESQTCFRYPSTMLSRQKIREE